MHENVDRVTIDVTNVRTRFPATSGGMNDDITFLNPVERYIPMISSFYPFEHDFKDSCSSG